MYSESQEKKVIYCKSIELQKGKVPQEKLLLKTVKNSEKVKINSTFIFTLKYLLKNINKKLIIICYLYYINHIDVKNQNITFIYFVNFNCMEYL